jgi:hypothetical protein
MKKKIFFTKLKIKIIVIKIIKNLKKIFFFSLSAWDDDKMSSKGFGK